VFSCGDCGIERERGFPTEVEDPSDDTVRENFYWFSIHRGDACNGTKGTGTPRADKSFADYTALETLPPLVLKVASNRGAFDDVTGRIRPVAGIPRCTEVRRVRDGDEVLPVLWRTTTFSRSAWTDVAK